MKLILRWRFLLSALCGTVLAVSFLAGGGITYAAARSSSVSTKASVPADSFVNVARDDSCQPDDVTLYNSGPVCFATVSPGYGNASINVYYVNGIYAGGYNLTFDWTDCHGEPHYGSMVAAWTSLNAADVSGGFAGCNYIKDVTYIQLQNV